MFPLRSLPTPLPISLVATAFLALPAAGQTPPARPAVAAPTANTGPGYADIADLTLAAPVVADVTIASAARIKGAEAAGTPPDAARFYVEGDVAAAIRGTGGVAARVGYLFDAPLAPDGRAPRLKKRRMVIFARPVGTAPGQLQLVAPDAQVDWTPAIDATARAVAAAAVAADAPPVVTGVGSAFHVAGSLPGEGETQVFLMTADHRPVSLSVLRRPGERPRWAVALGEVVDEAAAPPARDTLLWYRLACSLPSALPARATASLGDGDAEQARVDYRFVIASLGGCGRTRAGTPISGGGAPG